jgi:glycosyl-4,4'-diaponeurosporenoate acyltransferase
MAWSRWLPLFTSAAFWLLLSLLLGLLVNRLPEAWLADPGPGASPAQPSAGDPPAPAVRSHPRAPVRVAAPPGIRRWKRWIPDAGAALPGGVAKASLVRRDPQALARLLAETRRAELVHWLLWSAAPLTFLWLPPLAGVVNLVVASCCNAPCVVLQRHNRQRLRACLRHWPPLPPPGATP